MQTVPELADGIVVDVRSPEEHAQGSLPGSILAPIDSIRSHVGRLHVASGDGVLPIYVYCRKGIRAGKVVRYLRSLGYNAHNIGGTERGQAKAYFERTRQANPVWPWVVGGVALGTGALLVAADARARQNLFDARYRGMSYQLMYVKNSHPDGDWEWNAVGIEKGHAHSKDAALTAAKAAIDGRLDGRQSNPYNQGGYWSNPAPRQANLCGPGVGRLPAVYGATRRSNPSPGVLRRLQALNGKKVSKPVATRAPAQVHKHRAANPP